MERPLVSDPLRNFRFRVYIHQNVPGWGQIATQKVHSTIPIGPIGFMAVSGLAVTTEPISYREGGDNTTPRKMPGQSDFPPLSLTRGLFGDQSDFNMLWQWYRQIFAITRGLPNAPDDFRGEVFIMLYEHPKIDAAHPTGRVKASWRLFNAWPSSLAFSDLDAGGNGVMVQNLTLMYEGFDFATDEGDERIQGSKW